MLLLDAGGFLGMNLSGLAKFSFYLIKIDWPGIRL